MWIFALLLAQETLVTAPLVFREDFREVEAHIPIINEDLTSDFLTLKRLGPGAPQLKLSYHPEIENDPHYIWNGKSKGPVFVTFLFDHILNLSAPETVVQARTKNFGETTLHLALQVDHSDWFVQEKSIDSNKDWTTQTLPVHGSSWLTLNPETRKTAPYHETLTFAQVTAIGFFAPKDSKESKDCFRLDWFELRSSSAKIEQK